jgi:DNA-binding transcriptional regulator YdaS (Cro superfamily)
MSAIKEAVDLIGGQTVVANQLTTTEHAVQQNSVFYWINRHKQAPAKYIKKISELTNGEVTVEQLLADHENNQAKG